MKKERKTIEPTKPRNKEKTLAKKPWHPPELERLGDVRELTQGNNAGGTDAGIASA